ncbi:oligosaccharide flippase family protein [Rhizobium ruizarguesonis]|uniref:oligosaccharide flippase family protein n=1 Tax=Rhizobium ruizarguesonis TaxID=2081791 RepID=UPI00103176BF|nr:oligosaccharide flippase family protein [Rhizobium ruizarguesonis]MBY5888758.1 oligosaccharide flippase family protein [Rhizobium leguminosarum]QIO48424.1 oligosaccharide flippase family protein [Rhizobium leguminosarum bv. trifolii]QSZ04243.1 oligosaccharide flippase family protein [Rhizobium ruizarguesonis]TAW40812.1 hypothetical protein ELI17_30875 [Rhizobium ruizarguesonis]TAY09722.1 hypothetical protein ELH92_29255 [Rhizobium ruizarguesonis]
MMTVSAAIAKVRSLLMNQAVLLLNAGMLGLGTLMTAILGFVYWWLAARSFSAEAVGLAAAAISLMNLLANLGEVGLGPFLMGEIGRQKRAGPFLTGALLASFSASIVVGLIYLVIAARTSTQLGSIVGSSASDLFFVAGCALTAVTLVLDQALVGLLRSGLQLTRNVVFAASKLLLLIALGLTLGRATSGLAIFTTWFAGQLVSLVVVAGLLVYAGRRVFHRPETHAFRPVLGQVFGHHALSMAVQAPALLLPVVVTVMLSAEINAAFYAAWTVLNVALLVPASLASVLFAIAVREPELFPSRLRLSLGLSMLVCAATALAFLFLSRFMLWIFNPAYAAIAGNGLQFLGVAAFAMALKYHYLAVQRVRRRLGFATLVLIGGAVLEIVAAAGGTQFGIAGTANFWVIAVSLEGLFLCPALYWATRRIATPSTTVPPAAAGVSTCGNSLDETDQIGIASRA